mgnify:CR=1 FL=1
MNCQKAERLISKLVDGRLGSRDSARLEGHLRVCPSCAQLLSDYQKMKNFLSDLKITGVEPLPYFEERLKARLQTEARPSLWVALERWYAAAVPVFMVILLILAGVLFLAQPAEVQMSQSELLLFQNQNPLKDTQAFFEEEKPETRQLKLLFAGLDSQEIIRRGKQ